MTEIRHIVFDIGHILIHYDPHLAYLDILPDPTEREAFFKAVNIGDWNLEQDRGRSWTVAEDELIAMHPEKDELIRTFRRNWRLMVPRTLQDNVDLLHTVIDAGYDVTFLTNFASDTFREAQEMYPFLKKGRGVTVSGDVKLIKPDPAIYDLHTKTFGLDPAATLFIDDSEKNILAARAYGWNAIHLPPNEKALRPELERFGVRL